MTLQNFLQIATIPLVAVELLTDNRLINIVLEDESIHGVMVDNASGPVSRVSASFDGEIITTETLTFQTAEYMMLGSVSTPSSRKFTKTQFRARFTPQEFVAIEVDLMTTTDIVRRATLQVIKDELENATEVDLDYPATIFGVEALVGFGLLAQARGDEILGR